MQYQAIAEWFTGIRVLVTGAGGFVGNALARWLHEEGQAKVWTLIRDVDAAQPYHSREIYPRFIEGSITGDITDERVVERAYAESEPEIVFHLAAMSQVRHARMSPRENYRSNIMGTVNVLESARQIAPGATIVVASSDKAYGKASGVIDENTQINPIHPYDTAKASADLIAQSYAQYYQQAIIITRCGNIYGPGDANWQRLIPGVMRDLIYRRRPVLRSDGSHIRDYNYIQDIVIRYALCAIGVSQAWSLGPIQIPIGSAWLISSDKAYSVLDIVNACQAVIPWGNLYPPIIKAEASDETPKLVLNGERFRATFNPPAPTPLMDGLEETSQWLMDYMLGGLHGKPAS